MRFCTLETISQKNPIGLPINLVVSVPLELGNNTLKISSPKIAFILVLFSIKLAIICHQFNRSSFYNFYAEFPEHAHIRNSCKRNLETVDYKQQQFFISIDGIAHAIHIIYLKGSNIFQSSRKRIIILF